MSESFGSTRLEKPFFEGVGDNISSILEWLNRYQYDYWYFSPEGGGYMKFINSQDENVGNTILKNPEFYVRVTNEETKGIIGEQITKGQRFATNPEPGMYYVSSKNRNK